MSIAKNDTWHVLRHLKRQSFVFPCAGLMSQAGLLKIPPKLFSRPSQQFEIEDFDRYIRLVPHGFPYFQKHISPTRSPLPMPTPTGLSCLDLLKWLFWTFVLTATKALLPQE